MILLKKEWGFGVNENNFLLVCTNQIKKTPTHTHKTKTYRKNPHPTHKIPPPQIYIKKTLKENNTTYQILIKIFFSSKWRRLISWFRNCALLQILRVKSPAICGFVETRMPSCFVFRWFLLTLKEVNIPTICLDWMSKIGKFLSLQCELCSVLQWPQTVLNTCTCFTKLSLCFAAEAEIIFFIWENI